MESEKCRLCHEPATQSMAQIAPNGELVFIDAVIVGAGLLACDTHAERIAEMNGGLRTGVFIEETEKLQVGRPTPPTWPRTIVKLPSIRADGKEGSPNLKVTTEPLRWGWGLGFPGPDE